MMGMPFYMEQELFTEIYVSVERLGSCYQIKINHNTVCVTGSLDL